LISGAANASNNGTFTIASGANSDTLTLVQTNTLATDTSAATLVIALDPGTKDPTNPSFATLKSVTHSLIKTSDLPMTANGVSADGKQFYVEKTGTDTFKLHNKADLSDAALALVGPTGANPDPHTIGPEAVDLTGAG